MKRPKSRGVPTAKNKPVMCAILTSPVRSPTI
jgi:hypothetical protein